MARLQRLLANTVRAEAVIAIVVLIAVGVLIQLQSPRTSAEAAEQAAQLTDQTVAPDEADHFEATTEVSSLIMTLRIEPAQPGPNSFELGLGSQFGFIGEVLQTQLEFAREGEDGDGEPLELALTGSARYEAEGDFLSVPGDWTVTATVRRRGVEDVRASWTVTLDDPSEPIGEPGAGGSDSIWQSPFSGGRSAGAIVVLAVAAAAAVGVGAWQALRLRRSA